MEPNQNHSTQLALGMIFALALIGGAFSNKLSASVPQTVTSPLEFRISMKPKMPCRGRSVVLKAKMVNRSSESIAIDRRLVWYRSTFKYSTLESDNSIKGKIRTAIGDFGTISKDEDVYIILRPGQSYRASRSFALDEDFFGSERTFTVQMTYGQFLKPRTDGLPLFVGAVDSNAVEFKVANCKGSNSKNSRPGNKRSPTVHSSVDTSPSTIGATAVDH